MGTRVFVGRLHPSARERDLERFFKGYGRIREVMLKRGFAFVEFDDHRDADDAAYELNGKEILGERVSVELARGTPHGRDREGWRPPAGHRGDRNSRDFGGRGGARRDVNRSEYRIIVENLSSRVSWQDLKDFMRDAGEVVYTETNPRNNEGAVEFASKADMNNALSKLDGKEMSGRKIKLRSAYRARSRSRSKSKSKSKSRSKSRSPRRSRSASRSRSGSPKAKATKKPKERSASRSKSRSASPDRSREMDGGTNGDKEDGNGNGNRSDED